MKPTLISYSRVSSAKQLEGTGIEQQQDYKLLNQLSKEYGLPIDERTFSDEGLSGFHSHNLQGEFGRILQLISTGSIIKGSILVITSLDRLSRAKTNDAMELMLSVINRGIRIYTAMDSKLYCSDSPNLTADLIVSVIIMAQAHEESLKKSKRTKGNALALIERFHKGERAADGNPIAIKSVGSLPWWVESSDGSVKPHPYYFGVAQWIAQQSLSGVGTTKLLSDLNELYTPPNGKGWYRTTVTRFTKSKSLTGLAVFTLDGVEHELSGYFPQVITEDEFYQIQARKKTATHSRTSKNKPTILNGLQVLKCRSCGGGMNYYTAGGRKAYRCINGMTNRAKCKGMSCSSEPVHEAVKRSLTWFSVQPKPVKEDKVTPVVARLDEAQAKLNQMEADYMESPSNIMAKMLAQVEQDVEALRIELEETRLSQASTDDFGTFDEPETTDEYRDVIVRSVNTVQVHKMGRKEMLISIYFKSGLNKHYYIKNNEVLQEGILYYEPQAELDLLDKANWMLFVADGRLNQWIDTGKPLDVLPDPWEE
ncbi:recombinase family protein [Vibrio agarivorans]|uniref:recombinase family protein n=1 Tax=Vibrio agarivorans TaxID=153622 RepID=UPI002231A953|nr:recombinase family protein [Vibrio agarivorans]MDN3659939.1 recombinase family protein [Vibrio agarivorans]